MSALTSCVSVPRISLKLNFNYENGYVKTVELREGQLVKNLTFTVNGETKTVTGLVKVINYISKQGMSSKDGCFHDDVSNFDEYVSVTTLNIDCSKEYNFNVVQVPVKFIEDIESVEDVVVAPVEVNGVAYATVAEAIASAESGATVTLAEDFQSEEKITIEAKKVITIDLNGNKLYVPEVENNYGCVVKGDLTITGNGQVAAGGEYGIGVPADGKLTIEDGEFKSIGDYLIGSWGETVINGGDFHGAYCCVNGFDGAVTINGGNFVADTAREEGEWGWSVILGNVKVYGGTFSHPVHERYCPEGYRPKANSNGTYTVEAITE